MLGIDIHPYYQRSIHWPTVANGPVRYVWVKVSDGGTRYLKTVQGITYRPDGQVAGARSVGLPVGGYHYAQFSPSPEAQADVLTTEVRRVGALGLPPALDLEDPFVPGAGAREFAIQFLRRLQANGFGRVAIYANTSMLANIRPDAWNIPDLLIWAADYGTNNGGRNPDLRPYTGRADVHQYTSRGQLAGIGPEFVDLNESLTTLHHEEDEDMDWSDKVEHPHVPDPARPGRGKLIVVKDALLLGNDAAQRGEAIAKRLEVKLDALASQLSDDEANVIAAVRQIIADDEDVEVVLGPEQYEQLLAALPPVVKRGLREVFTQAGQEQETPS